MEFTTLLNFRDFGGYIGADGKKVRKGMLFRSEGLHRLTEAEQLALREEYRIRTVVDFRSDAERQVQPDLLPEGITSYALTPEAKLAEVASGADSNGKRMSTRDKLRAGMGSNFIGLGELMPNMMRSFVTLEHNRAVYHELLMLHSKPECVAILQHCKGGKDRTGFGCAMVLAALGVSKEDIMEDYLRSNEQKASEIEMLMSQYREETDDPAVLEGLYAMLTVQPNYMQAAFDAMDELYGGLEQFITEGLQINAETRKALRELYLEA